MSDSLRPHGLSSARVLQARILEWVAISLFQWIFLTQGLNLRLLNCRQILYHLSYKEAPTPFVAKVKYN